MFINYSHLLSINPPQANYGVAVTDIDNDGRFEIVVAGYGGPNLIYQWQGSEFTLLSNEVIMDTGRMAIGVAAGDLDGDGREELYVLNTDTFAGQKYFADRLFDAVGDQWVDLFSVPENQETLNLTAGRSVICVDRTGRGRYGFYVANYGGHARFYELDDDGLLDDIAFDIGVDLVSGGRGAVSLPLVSTHMDIFAANERGPNFFFRNLGDGTYREEAYERLIEDAYEHGRGIAVFDANGDGRFDIVYGNWQGDHRLYLQQNDGTFINQATPELAYPSRIRTVIAADFDNDGYEEIFFNNIGESNRLYKQIEGQWRLIDIGDAAEPSGLGTGAAVGDFNGDGRLELFIAHGERGAQPLSLYHAAVNNHHWLRVLPRTKHGAPARGAVVELQANGRTQMRAIDAGSGYLCQMEPVAHFGLGAADHVDAITVRWPDGVTYTVNQPEICQTLDINYPSYNRQGDKETRRQGE